MTRRSGPEDLLAVLGGPVVGARRTNAQSTQFFEGKVLNVAAEGLYFIVPDWDQGRHKFGPAPWPRTLVEPSSDGDPMHDHEGSTPSPGDRCLALLLNRPDGSTVPWVLGWWPA